MRPISTVPNREGLLELGPCESGPGLGDMLTITPLAEALGDKAVMILPPNLAHLEFVFAGLCHVKISKDYPEFQWVRGNAATQKLAKFNLHTHSPLPVIRCSMESIQKANEYLRGIPNPIAFVPTCSAHWAHVRQRPFVYWRPVVEELRKRYTVCQFGRKEYETLPGARRMPWVDLETLAAIYHQIQNYVGVDTGDYHLMIAVGGRCVVAEPEPMPPEQADMWTYKTPRIVYGKLNHPQTMLDAIKRMGL
jgi:hypothetical protein